MKDTLRSKEMHVNWDATVDPRGETLRRSRSRPTAALKGRTRAWPKCADYCLLLVAAGRKMEVCRDELEFVKSRVSSFPDFPKKGILFRDIFSVLADPEASKQLHYLLVEHVKAKTPDVQVFVALESRGFLFGSTLAQEFGVPFVPIRKKGKLPGPVYQESYALEYGTDTLELQKNIISAGQKVVIVDDLIATGGTLEAGCRLVRRSGATVAQCLVVMELMDLKGRENVSAEVHSFLQY